MCRILSQLTRLLRLEPACLEAHASSLKLVCKDQRVDSPVLAKALLALFVQVNIHVKYTCNYCILGRFCLLRCT